MGRTLVAIVIGLVTAIGIVLSGIQAYACHKDISADKTNKKALRNYRIFIMCIIVLAVVGGSATASASYSPTNSNGSSVTPTPSVVGAAPTPAPTEAQSISLASLGPIQGTDPVETDPANLGGTSYLDLVRQDSYNCNKWQTDYDLGKKYRIFTAQAGLS